MGADDFDYEGAWRLDWRWTDSINYDVRLHFYQPECPQSTSDLVVSSSVGVVVLFGGITPCRCKRVVQQRWCELSWPGPSWNWSITRKTKSQQVTKLYFAIFEQLLNINPRKEKTKKKTEMSSREHVGFQNYELYRVTKKCFWQKFWNFIKKLFSIEEFL